MSGADCDVDVVVAPLHESPKSGDPMVTVDVLDVETGGGEPISIEDFPPLPRPDFSKRRREAAGGVNTVLVLMIVFIGVTHAISANPRYSGLSPHVRFAALVIMYSFGGIALICLERLLRADPGVVRRSQTACYPMPERVRAHLLEPSTTKRLRNVTVGKNIYCVRCLVWRPDTAHHCSTCQRCVHKFDHHCGVFGRCVGGNYKSGNIPYFFALIVTGYLSAIVCLTILVAAIVCKEHPPAR